MKANLKDLFELNASDAVVLAPVVWGGYKDVCERSPHPQKSKEHAKCEI